MMISTLVLELALIQTPKIVKNYYERSRSRSISRLTSAKETGSNDKNKWIYKIKINLCFYHDCKILLKPFILICVL